jgi:hypothetical protein
MEFTPYDQGEDLIHEATYGFYVSYDSAQRAADQLSESDSNLPRGDWVISDELVYESV